MGTASGAWPGAPGRVRGGPVTGRLGHRDREGEARAEADAAALGPDAPTLCLDQALADRESQPAADVARPVSGGGVLAEQLAELVRRDAPALVGDRDRHMQPLALGRDPDGSGFRSVARGVGEQVVEHLHQARPVGHDPGQVGRQVDADGVPPAAADERAAGLVHQRGDLGGLGRDRQRAGVDAPGVEQVADQAVHAVGLLVDDAEELRHLGRADDARGAEHRGGRALDRGQRRAQLVAHHAQELGPHALELSKRLQVLHGDHHRGERAVRAVRVVDRGGVDERRDAAPVGNRERNLLGPHRLGAAQRARERELVERDLAPVGAPAGDDLEQLLGGLAGAAQALDDASGLAVERDQVAGPGIEHHDADRRGLDQGLQAGAGALLGAVGARVGDRRRGLRGEQHQDLLILVGELRAAFLVDQVEIADMRAAMAHRRALEGLRWQTVGREAEAAHVVGHIRQAHRSRKVAEIFKEPRPVGPFHQRAVLLVGQARGDEVLGRARLVDGRDGAVARGGERAGALHHLVEHGLEVETRADAQARRTQR